MTTLRSPRCRNLTAQFAAAGIIAATVATAHGQASTSVPPDTHARAPYILPDGSIQIITFAGMGGIIRGLDDLYVSTHPGVKFTLREGDNYSAMAALTFDRSAVAPLGAEYTRIGLGDNLKIAAEPLGFRVAHASLVPSATVPALGVIVNPKNPLAALSLTKLTRIFAVGGPSGDIATWSQAGLQGPLAGHLIHPIGPLASDSVDSDDPQVGEFLSTDKMSGLNMYHNYVALPHYADVVQRVSDDPDAIGITALNVSLAGVRVLPLKAADTDVAVSPDAASIAAGRYPIDRFIYIYLRLGKGSPLEDFGREYMRMVLSPAGQHVIAAQASGYLPLNDGELAQERAKLDH